MANFVFKHGVRNLVDRGGDEGATLDWETAHSSSQGLQVLLLTSALTKNGYGDATNLTFSTPTWTFVGHSGSPTATEFTTSGTYARQNLANMAWVTSDGAGGISDDGWVGLEATNVTFSTLGANGDLKIVGALLVEQESSTAFRPIAYFDFEVTPDASDVIIQWAGLTGHTSSGSKGIVIKIA